jgi:hypothetical protein
MTSAHRHAILKIVDPTAIGPTGNPVLGAPAPEHFVRVWEAGAPQDISGFLEEHMMLDDNGARSSEDPNPPPKDMIDQEQVVIGELLEKFNIASMLVRVFATTSRSAAKS